MMTQANPAIRQTRFASEAGQREANSPDWLLIGAVIALTVIGLVFVFSASVAVGQQLFGDPRYFAVRQLTGAVVGLIAFVALARFDYQRLRTWSPLILLIAIIALIAVLMPGIGVEQNGARRWMQIGPLPPVQPSEFAKLAVAIYVAAWLASRGPAIRHVTLGVVPFAVMVGFFGFLIMAEPDLGTALVIVIVAGAMFFIAGAALRHILALTAVGGGVLFGIIAIAGYGLDRFTSFVAAESDPQASGFQTLQLLIALGSGGPTGVGIGESRQKFLYVPSAHTDGVFAIIGEEAGFVGALLVMGLVGFLVYRGARIAARTSDPFGMLLATGIVTWIALQAFFNIGGVTRTIPLTGIPLPFISFGSSALVATLAAAGVLVSISRFARQDEGPAWLQRRQANQNRTSVERPP